MLLEDLLKLSSPIIEKIKKLPIYQSTKQYFPINKQENKSQVYEITDFSVNPDEEADIGNMYSNIFPKK